MKLPEIIQNTNRKHIETWLHKNGIFEYTITDKGYVNVDADVFIPTPVTKLEVQFGTVSGSFSLERGGITSLVGCPFEVGEDFFGDRLKITSLVGAPVHVGGSFDVDRSQITSLEGAPRHIGGTLYCNNTNLSSLEGCPDYIHKAFCYADTPLSSRVLRLFKYKAIHHTFSTAGQDEIGRRMIDAIVNRHLAGDRDILACQDELIDAGFSAIAKL